MGKVRRSFDIEEADLKEARRLAKSRGLSLFRYFQDAVAEKNAGTTSLDLMRAMEERLTSQMAKLRTDHERTRLELRDDFDGLAEQLSEQNQKLLKTTDAQIRAFINLLREHLAEPEESTSDGGSWAPGNTY